MKMLFPMSNSMLDKMLHDLSRSYSGVVFTRELIYLLVQNRIRIIHERNTS